MQGTHSAVIAALGLLALLGVHSGASAQETGETGGAGDKIVLLCDEGGKQATWEERWEIAGDRLTFLRDDRQAGSTMVEHLPDYYRATLDQAEIWINRYTLQAFIAESEGNNLMLTRTLQCRVLDRKI